MLLKGDNGTEFELALIRDSVAEQQDGFGDEEWATVSFRAVTQDDSWEETAPCINLFGLANLAEWLEAVGENKSGEFAEIEILEPELKFSLPEQSDEEVTIRVGFHLENRPEEYMVDAPTDEAEFVDVHLSRQTVLAAAEALRHDIADAKAAEDEGDGLLGEGSAGVLGRPDPDLNMIDTIEEEPPGAGFGMDNAGNR